MRRVLLLLVFAGAGLAQAATVDWQGGSTDLNVPANWYLIASDDPANYTTNPPTTQLPTSSDRAYVRNGTSVTISSGTITTGNVYLGGPAIPGGTGLTTTLTVGTGGTLLATPPMGSFSNTGYIRVGGTYNTTVNQSGGLVMAKGLAGANIDIFGGQPGVSATYNLTGGTLRTYGVLMASRLRVGFRSVSGDPVGPGYFNQSGGLVEIVSDNATNMPRIGEGLDAQGTYNLSAGTLRIIETGAIGGKFNMGADGGTGTFNHSGGLADFAWLAVGYNNPGKTAIGHGTYNLTGGTLKASYKMTFGRTEDTIGIVSYGELSVNQAAVIDAEASLGFEDLGTGTLHLSINSASDFNIRCGSFWGTESKLVVSLTDEYVPASQQRWKIMAQRDGLARDAGNVYLMEMTFTDVTEDFAVEKDEVTAAYYLVYTGTPPQPHAGDANNDGFVDVGDLGILAFNWGQSPRAWAQGNFTTPDDIVDVGDLGVLAFNWGWVGAPAGAGNVPEPASLSLLALGGLLAVRRRR